MDAWKWQPTAPLLVVVFGVDFQLCLTARTHPVVLAFYERVVMDALSIVIGTIITTHDAAIIAY